MQSNRYAAAGFFCPLMCGPTRKLRRSAAASRAALRPGVTQATVCASAVGGSERFGADRDPHGKAGFGACGIAGLRIYTANAVLPQGCPFSGPNPKKNAPRKGAFRKKGCGSGRPKCGSRGTGETLSYLDLIRRIHHDTLTAGARGARPSGYHDVFAL